MNLAKSCDVKDDSLTLSRTRQNLAQPLITVPKNLPIPIKQRHFVKYSL